MKTAPLKDSDLSLAKREQTGFLACPKNFNQHCYEKTFRVEASVLTVWQWLNKKETFTKGQIPPFRVEFVNPTGGEGEFVPGVLCSHHGPLISFSGQIGEMKEPAESQAGYRDLSYFYGSYALSFRLVRPTRLEFWLEEDGEGCLVALKLTSFVNKLFQPIWANGLKLFWSSFAWDCRRRFK